MASDGSQSGDGLEDGPLSLSGFYRPRDKDENRAEAVKLRTKRGEIYKLGWVKKVRGGASSQSKDYSQAWLLTFTDLVVLLLTFFVLNYSMSILEQDKWQEIVAALSEHMRIERPAVLPVPAADFGIDFLDETPGVDLDYLKALLQQRPSLQGVLLNRLSDRLVLSLPNDLLFDPGSILLRAEGREVLDALGKGLSYIDNRIEVAGHADPTVARNVSNWELSLMRAISASQVLKKRSGQTVVARGYGDSRYDRRPAELANWDSFARRVDIVIYHVRGDIFGDDGGSVEGDNLGGGVQ